MLLLCNADRVHGAEAHTGSGVCEAAEGALPASSSCSCQAPAPTSGSVCRAAADGRRPLSSVCYLRLLTEMWTASAGR